MKKLLSMLGAIGLVATSSANVVACGSKAGDSDASGPSSDDVAKWDAMDVHEFEKTVFEKTVYLMFDDDDGPSSEHDALWDSIGVLADTLGLTSDDNGHWIPNGETEHHVWKTNDTIDFQNAINQWWTRDAYNLINYGIDRIKKDDAGYDYWEDQREGPGSTFEELKFQLELIENNLSPVKDVTVNVKFSEWDKLINKVIK